MKLCNKISKGVAKGAEVICMLTIAALVLVIVVELLRRNFLGQSFGGNVQLCGILFLWMAFIGLIPLYRDSGLMRLDFLVARTKGPVYEVLYFANKLFSLLLGVVMVVAFAAQYPYVSTRTYSTFPIPVPYTCLLYTSRPGAAGLGGEKGARKIPCHFVRRPDGGPEVRYAV